MSQTAKSSDLFDFAIIGIRPGEPLSNLDASLRGQMRTELARLHQKLGTTMIYVTHDQVEAMTLGDRIVVFNKGHIEQVGLPLDLYQRPTTEFVATFLGMPKMNMLSCKLKGRDNGFWKLTLGKVSEVVAPETLFDCADQSNIKVGIRPEHLLVGAEGDPNAHIHGRVSLVENLGDAAILHIKCEGIEGVRLENGKQTTIRLFFNQRALACPLNSGATAFLCPKPNDYVH